MNRIFAFILFTSFGLVLLSCAGNCNCSREIRCTRLTAVNMNNNSVMEHRIYCSTFDYKSDQAFQDSVGRFYKRHYNDNSKFFQSDTILSNEYKTNVRTKDVELVEKNGFTCSCYK